MSLNLSTNQIVEKIIDDSNLLSEDEVDTFYDLIEEHKIDLNLLLKLYSGNYDFNDD